MKTLPPNQHEALNKEECELARVVRALPSGEIPPELDALILKAASDAVAASHSTDNHPWSKRFLGTSAFWLGTAAASVLTIGIGWQVFQSMSAPIYMLPEEEKSMPASAAEDSDKSDSLVVEMIPPREPMPTSPPPLSTQESSALADAPAKASEKSSSGMTEMRAREEAVSQKSADSALAKSNGNSIVRDQAAQSDWIPPAAGSVAPKAAAPALQAMPAPASVAAEPYSATDMREAKELDKISVTGSRVGQVEAEAGQPAKYKMDSESSRQIKDRIAEDAQLSPALWLQAIQTRQKNNDLVGAKASLKLFKNTYPLLRIPENLKPLLQ